MSLPENATSPSPTPGRWFAWAWVVLIALGVTAALGAGSAVAPCRLDTVAEPEGWRDWPLVPTGGGGVRLEEGQLTGGNVCPGGVLSLSPWLGVHDGVAPEVWVRRGPGREKDAFVVASTPTRDDAPRERFVLAVRPAHGWHIAHVSPQAATGLAIIWLSLGAMIVGLVVARRRLHQAERLGQRSESDGLGGQLSYRVPSRPAKAPEVNRSPEQAIRTALVAVATLFGAGLAGAGCVLAREVLRALR